MQLTHIQSQRRVFPLLALGAEDTRSGRLSGRRAVASRATGSSSNLLHALLSGGAGTLLQELDKEPSIGASGDGLQGDRGGRLRAQVGLKERVMRRRRGVGQELPSLVVIFPTAAFIEGRPIRLR